MNTMRKNEPLGGGSDLWQSASAGELRFRSWGEDDLTVVYNTASGDTHLIDSSDVDILQRLQASPPSGVSGTLH